MRPGISELTGEEGERPEEIAAGVQRSIRFLFLVLGVVLLAKFWGFDEQALQTLDGMRIYSVRVAGAEPEFVTAGDLVRAMLIFIVTFWILRALPGLFEVAIFPRIRMDEGVKYATLTISRYTVFVVGIFLALSAVHLDLGRLGWLMAAIGVGLGFGLQQIVSNFVSGIILLVERPVRPGDTVTIGDISGKVQRINIRATTILNPDRQEVVVPNSSLITGNVTNWTRGDTINRLVIPIGVAYGSDVAEVSALLLRIATEQPEVLADPAPSVVFMAHGESSLDFNLRVFVPGPDDIMALRNRLNTLINKAFASANIEIPFPQRDLHIRSSDVPLAQVVATEDSK
jgi:potassium efflux system protein